MDPSTESADGLLEITGRCANGDGWEVARATVVNQVRANPGTRELQNQLRSLMSW